ncbi:hypothetical protein CKO25_01760 [Thiocapsa imhoffii]|uniref:Uncharacterized protein n=1 Tax=Thiocapsa imhoffii TaxID=382777 RepID=A0A9X1B7V2_9GAMM|nr:hypothetical protein [Thiocapsa imhoffii]MBK1643400.1 hypothetical protein [Thiocapsa imhoffii]
MEDLVTSARLVDFILVLVLVEGAGLWLWHRLTGQGVAGRELIGLLLAGAFLLLALRAALQHAGWEWIALWLTLALIAHLADLIMRWRRGSRGDRP